jgi:hypothetical protein
MRLRTAARIDANQQEIVDGLRKFGAKVWIIGRPVDLLVLHRRKFYVMEIKDPAKPPSERRLTDAQVEFFTECGDAPVRIITTLIEAIDFIQEKKFVTYQEARSVGA